MRNPYQLTLPCGWLAVLEDEPASLLHDIQHTLDGTEHFADEWNKLMLSLCGTSGKTLYLTSQYFVQRFKHSLKDILKANGLTLKVQSGLKPVFGFGGKHEPA